MTQNLPAKSEKEMVYTMDNGDEMRLTMSMVRQFLVQGHAEYVTDSEIYYFMHECKARRLNPYLRQCWLIKYSRKDNAQIVEAIHHKRSKARKAPDCNGWEKGLILKDAKGEIKYSKGLVLDGEDILGAYFKATPESWKVPYELELNLSGYIKKKQDGSITSFWSKEKQPSQIMKVVESQGLSALWGDTVGNTSIPEELPAAIDFTPGKGGMYETESPELDTSDFDDLAAAKIDCLPGTTYLVWEMFNTYLKEMAAAQEPKMTVDQFKVEGAAQFEELWAHFETWRKAKPDTGKPEIDSSDPWNKKAWVNLRPPGFATFVHKNLATFKDAPVKTQAKAISKWSQPNFYPETPFPILNEIHPTVGTKDEPGKLVDAEFEEPGPDGQNGKTGFKLTDEAYAALGPEGPEIYRQACHDLNFDDGPFSDVTDRAVAARMSTIAERGDLGEPDGA